MNAFAKVDVETFFRFAAEHPEQRYELDKGRIVQQMTGGSRRHAQLARRIADMIDKQIDPADWTVLIERGVKVGQSARYADVLVEPASEPGESLATSLPVVMVEVLSPSTTANDLNTKPAEYLSLASLDAYIVVSQHEPAAMVWQRDPQGRFPPEGVEITDGSIVIDGRGMCARLPLDEIYRGLL